MGQGFIDPGQRGPGGDAPSKEVQAKYGDVDKARLWLGQGL